MNKNNAPLNPVKRSTKTPEFECIRVFVHNGKLYAQGTLYPQDYPLDGDYVYIFRSKWGYVAISYQGEFEKEFLKKWTHKLIADLYPNHECVLEDYYGDRVSAKNYVQTLKQEKGLR